MRAVLLPLVAVVALAIGATSGVSAQSLEIPQVTGTPADLDWKRFLAPDFAGDTAPPVKWYTHIGEGRGNAPKGGRAGILGSNAEGTHFIVGFMQNEINRTRLGYEVSPGSNTQQTISLASRFATTVKVKPRSGDSVMIALAPYVPRTLTVDPWFECFGETVSPKGIEITSDLPISVYVYSAKETTSDGYLALPVSSWGTQYVSANFQVDSYTPIGDDWWQDEARETLRHGEFAVIASEDATTITIYPATMTLGGAQRMQPYRRTINKGEIFQVHDGGYTRGLEDLTGSVITADKPVGLLSGHVRAGVPTIFDHGKDHLIEMLPPRNTLGRRYMVVPFGGREGGDIVRVISAFEGSTQITITKISGESVVATLPAIGEHYQLQLTDVSIITATQPVLVTQYAKSSDADPRNRPVVTVNFDPDMVVITPEEQFVNAAVFQTLPNIPPGWGAYKQFHSHYVTIVAERAGFSSMKINGFPVTTQPDLTTGDITGTPFVWATLKLGDGMAHVLSGDGLFGGYVYGLGSYDSYAWPVGSGLRKFDLPPDTIPPEIRSTELCGVHEYFAKDSGYFASGLRRVTMDTAASRNVSFQQTLLIIGDEISLGRLRLINPRLSGRARLIAEDLNGNKKELLIDLESTAPTFSRDSIYFGIMDIGEVGRQTLRITNNTSRDIRLDQVSLTRRMEFLFDNPQQYQNRRLAPGESVDLNVLFRTIVRRTHRDTVIITSGCIDYAFPLTAVVPNPGILSGDVPYGRVRRGTAKTLQVTVRNPGQATLTIDSARLSGHIFTTDFMPRSAPAVTIAPGQEVSFDVTFRPTDVIVYRDSITFYSNADSIEVATLTGEGIYPFLMIGSYDFGRVQIGRDSSASIPFRNIGTDNATVTGVQLQTPDGFIVEPFAEPIVLKPEEIRFLPVTFRPTEEKAYFTPLLLLNEDGLEAGGQLQGIGYQLRASIDGCDWGRQWVGTSHDSVRHVRNIGSEPVTISRVEIEDGDEGEFRIIDLAQLPVTLLPGDSLPVTLQFSPMFKGERSTRIKATTSSLVTPEISADLLGFGLEAGASDILVLDSSLAYACATREGEIAIENTGNTELTLATVSLDVGSPFVTMLDAPAPGDKIGAGEASTIGFMVDFDGKSGPVTGRISWSFVELAGTFSREFTIEGRPQYHSIIATTPANVAIDGEFNLLVRVDSIFWKGVPEDQVTLEVEYNPTVARFDPGRWLAFADTTTSGWIPMGDPLLSDGSVIIRLKPAPGAAGTLDSVLFIPLPFRGYLGDNRLDTFGIRMMAGDQGCAPPSLASVPYAVDSICGLSQRLFVLTGPAYRLSQNTPNPVTLRTSIDFTLGMDAETTLEIFAADGKLVRTLVSEVLPAGDYSIPVEVADMPSGHYFYRLRSGAFNATRQMRITK